MLRTRAASSTSTRRSPSLLAELISRRTASRMISVRASLTRGDARAAASSAVRSITRELPCDEGAVPGPDSGRSDNRGFRGGGRHRLHLTSPSCRAGHLLVTVAPGSEDVKGIAYSPPRSGSRASDPHPFKSGNVVTGSPALSLSCGNFRASASVSLLPLWSSEGSESGNRPPGWSSSAARMSAFSSMAHPRWGLPPTPTLQTCVGRPSPAGRNTPRASRSFCRALRDGFQ